MYDLKFKVNILILFLISGIQNLVYICNMLYLYFHPFHNINLVNLLNQFCPWCQIYDWSSPNIRYLFIYLKHQLSLYCYWCVNRCILFTVLILFFRIKALIDDPRLMLLHFCFLWLPILLLVEIGLFYQFIILFITHTIQSMIKLFQLCLICQYCWGFYLI